eukprot:4392391-Pyramimonas_sp.AAC.1
MATLLPMPMPKPPLLTPGAASEWRTPVPKDMVGAPLAPLGPVAAELAMAATLVMFIRRDGSTDARRDHLVILLRTCECGDPECVRECGRFKKLGADAKSLECGRYKGSDADAKGPGAQRMADCRAKALLLCSAHLVVREGRDQEVIDAGGGAVVHLVLGDVPP